MASPEVIDWIHRVLEETRTRKISWQAINPTTFVWDSMTPKRARVNLQRIDRIETTPLAPGHAPTPRRVSGYILQAFDVSRTPANIPVVTVNGVEDPNANVELEKLFREIGTVTSLQAVEFLRSLLPPEIPSEP